MDNIYKELTNLEDYEFSTRLDYFIKKKGYSRNDFYKLIEKNEDESINISERTYNSYFCNGTNKRYPKKDLTKLMAEKLEIKEFCLTPHTAEFKQRLEYMLNFYAKIFKCSKEKVINMDFDNMFYDADMGELEYVKYIWEQFNELFIKTNYSVTIEVRASVLLILQYYFDNLKKIPILIDEKNLDIINFFLSLNDKGKKKLINYGKIIINKFKNDEQSPYLYNFDDLCKAYDLNIDKLEQAKGNSSNNKIGKINETKLKKEIEKRIYYDYNFADFIECLNDFSKCKPCELEIILICLFIDYKNNNFFPIDAIESLLLIAQLFSMDKEFNSI